MHPYDVVLLKVSEECSEVAENASRLSKQAMKTLRFGIDSLHGGKTNQQRLVEDYQALQDELFDLRVALLIYNQYAIAKGAAPQEEIDQFGLDNFTEAEYPGIVRRLSRYVDTLDVTMERMHLSWEDAEAFSNLLIKLISHLSFADNPTPRTTP